MKNPHLTQPVVAWGRSLATARIAVIALHGRAQHPGDIQSVCARIGLDDFACLAPTAPESSWYPQVFTAPLDSNEPKLSQSLAGLDALVREVIDAGIARERIVMLGFSQGACLLAEYSLRHPARYGALVVLTGSAIGPEGRQWPYAGDFGGTQVLVSGATHDPWIPEARMRETARLFADRGAQVVEHYYRGAEHVVNDEEISLARRLVEELR
ncbi:MAG: phospholipase [Steroidobacteraceae bacterium]